MVALIPSLVVVAGCVAGTLLLGWGYFARCALTRPPLGVVNGWDVGAMIGGIVVAPLLYIGVAGALATAILGGSVLGLLYAVAEPLVRARWALWLAVLALEGAALGAGLGQFGPITWAINDGVISVVVVGLANLWAQGGMSARAMTVLAAFLTLYDVVATSWLPLTTQLTAQLGSGPFAPVVGWGTGRHHLELGLGDLVLATLFPLVMRKAFGDTAGAAALALALVTLIGLLVAVSIEVSTHAMVLPVMAVLGPVMIVDYICCARRCGGEQTTVEYRRHQAARSASAHADNSADSAWFAPWNWRRVRGRTAR
jgi:hypothetical protein